MQISRKRLETKVRLQWDTIWRIDWSRDRRRHVTQKGHGRDQDIKNIHYLKNGWR